MNVFFSFQEILSQNRALRGNATNPTEDFMNFLRLDHVTLWCNIACNKKIYPKEVNISLARINEKRTMVNSGQSRGNKSDKSQC